MISMDNAKQIVRRNIPGCVIKGIIVNGKIKYTNFRH